MAAGDVVSVGVVSARIDSADAGGGMTAERPAQMSGLDTTDATVAAALDARPSVPATT